MPARFNRRSFLKLSAAAAALPLLWRLANRPGSPSRAGQNVRGWPFQLHLHAHSSHARSVAATRAGELPSMRWHSANAAATGVNNLWWSEHDHAYHQQTEHVIDYRPARKLQVGQIIGMRPNCRSAGFGSNISPPLSARPILKINSGGPGKLKVKCYLSWHPREGGGEVREIRSWYQKLGDQTIDLQAKLFAKGVSPDNVVEKIQLIARKHPVRIRRVSVKCQDDDPIALFEAQKAIIAANSAEYGTQEFLGVEHTSDIRLHHNAYMPTGASQLTPDQLSFTPTELASSVHAGNGLLALNHPCSVGPTSARVAGPPPTIPGRAAELVQQDVHSADIIESGYLSGRGWGSSRMHLWLWDLIVANRKFLANPRVILGVGVSDSHGKDIMRHGGPNATWLIADHRPERQEAVEIMRVGQMYFGDYEVVPTDSASPLDLSIDLLGNISRQFPEGFSADDAYLVEVPTLTSSEPDYEMTMTRTPLAGATIDPGSTSLYRLELWTGDPNLTENRCIASTNHRGVGYDDPNSPPPPGAP